MKKRVVFFGIVFLMLVCVIGIASAAVSIYGYEYNDFQIGLSTQRPDGGGFYSRGVQFQYAINDLPTDNMSSTIAWSVSPTNGGPALTITAEGTGRMSTRAWLNLDPTVSYTIGGPYTYQISMDINGSITSKNITVSFVNNQLPTSYGLTVTPVELTASSATLGTTVNMTNREMYMVSGKTYAVTAVIGGTTMSYSTIVRMWSPTEWNEIGIWSDSRLMDLNLDNSNTGVYTAQQMGTYDDHYYVVSFYGNNFSNIGCYIPYTLYVTDESGNLPEEKPILYGGTYNWADKYDDEIDYTVYLGVGIDPSQPVWNDHEFINFHLGNYSDLYNKFGGEPTWNVTADTISGEALDYSWSSNPNGIWGQLNAMPTTASESTFTISCSWGGKTATKKVHVHAVPLNFTLPTGIEISGVDAKGEYSTQAGETITIEASVQPGTWAGVPGFSQTYFCANGLWSFASQDQTYSSSTGAKYYVYGAGTYDDLIGISCGALMITKQVTFKVKSQSGNVPIPQLINAPVDATWYMGLPWGGPGQSGIHSMSAIAQLWFPDDERDMNDLNITWELVHENGPDNFELYHYPDSSNPETYFFGMVQPKSGQLTTGDSEYTMKATYKGITYEGKMTLHTVNTGMPTGVTFRVFETSGGDIGTEVPITNGTLTVESGKKYWISGLFTGGTAAPTNQWINNQYNDRGVTRGNRWNWGPRTAYGIYSSNTEMFTADTPGTYSCEADLSIGLTNLGWCMPFTMVVTNPSTSDPYFMEPMISIKNEYEADEEVLISFPWVNGAEYHEIRIFNMDGTDAYSWSNVHWERKDIQGDSCCFQVNVDAGAGQNRLMDPGDYYTIITLRGTGYRETTFRRDFTILNTSGGHGGHTDDPNGLENGNSTWTWYVGLGGEWPHGDGVGSDIGIIQFRIQQKDWIGADAGLPIWAITNNHSSAADCYEFTYVTETWNKGRGISLRPTWNSSDETVTGPTLIGSKPSTTGRPMRARRPSGLCGTTIRRG